MSRCEVMFTVITEVFTSNEVEDLDAIKLGQIPETGLFDRLNRPI